MSNKTERFIKRGILASATLAMFALAPSVMATPVQIGFNGAGGSGHVSLTVGPDATPGDPSGAQLITNASGTFSDAMLNITNAPITGVVARNFATPDDVANGSWQPGDLPFPASYSKLAVLNPPPHDTAITFDELFYADGSPKTCWDYPFSGGFLDGYGAMFKLDNGSFVDLWSDGVASPGGLTYGFAVLTPNSDNQLEVKDFQFGGVYAAVPEPDFVWMFGSAVLGLFAWRRKAERKA
ncbi:MAG: PEP-CTERM sorting domain-containing protein [Rhodanobacter sp.]